MSISTAPAIAVIKPVRDEFGDRVVVSLQAKPPELACDCTGCRANLEAGPTDADEERGR